MNSQDCGCCDFDGPQALSTPVKNNYFYGKLLDEQHFRMEQRYFNMKRWLLNRLAVGEGVLCGLDLKVAAYGQLTLAPGVAVDGLGREILVPVATVFDPRSSPTPAASRRVRPPPGRSPSGWPITPAPPSRCRCWSPTATRRPGAHRARSASRSPSW